MRNERETLAIELIVASSQVARQVYKVEQQVKWLAENAQYLSIEELKVQRRYLSMLVANSSSFTHLHFNRSGR